MNILKSEYLQLNVEEKFLLISAKYRRLVMASTQVIKLGRKKVNKIAFCRLFPIEINCMRMLWTCYITKTLYNIIDINMFAIKQFFVRIRIRAFDKLFKKYLSFQFM